MALFIWNLKIWDTLLSSDRETKISSRHVSGTAKAMAILPAIDCSQEKGQSWPLGARKFLSISIYTNHFITSEQERGKKNTSNQFFKGNIPTSLKSGCGCRQRK